MHSASECQLSRKTAFVHQDEDIPDSVFFSPHALYLLWGTLSLAMLLPFLAPHFNPRPECPLTLQICKGATQDERLQWCLPEGAAFSWLPNPENSLEGRRSILSTLDCPQSLTHSAQDLSSLPH